MTTVRRPQPFVMVASDHGPMIVNRLDAHMLPNGAVYGVGHQIMTTGGYDREEVAHIISLINARVAGEKGVVVLDCGANIGVHTVEIAKSLTGRGEVIAVEPQERLYYALCGNIAINNLFNARAIFGAVGSSNGTIAMPRPNYNKAASFGSLEIVKTPRTEHIGQSISWAKKDCGTVTLYTIDKLVELADLARLDFIKLDVEGMEVPALRGAESAIARFRPTMLIEYIKSDVNDLHFLLTNRGYEIEQFGANWLATPRT